MRSPLVFAFSIQGILVAGALCGCGSSTQYPEQVATDRARMEVPVVKDDEKEARSTALQRESEALGYLVAIDEQEVRAGADAEKKDVRPPVKEFAKAMQREHALHADATRAVAREMSVALVDTPVVAKVREEGDRALAAMFSLEGDEFDRAYVAAMIDGHEKALARIDEYLADTTLREPLHKHLAATREVVAKHLTTAQSLRAK